MKLLAAVSTLLPENNGKRGPTCRTFILNLLSTTSANGSDGTVTIRTKAVMVY